MTTGEKLAFQRKRAGMTQDILAELLRVSRQSVSRWEMDVAFPETEKLIRLSRIYDCSIDFLLNNTPGDEGAFRQNGFEVSLEECVEFVQNCGCFFLATAIENVLRLRPMGHLYLAERNLYFITYREKRV